MPARVTIRDVAAAAGVSAATASRALNERVKCAPATRDRVVQAAREMGYMPDPGLAALARYRRSSRQKPHRYTAVWLTELDERRYVRPASLVEASVAAGREYGYRIEVCRIDDLGGPAAASRILHHRGVDGILAYTYSDPRTC